MGGFLDKLDDMVTEASPETAESETLADEVPEAPPVHDPLAHLIGCAEDSEYKDPFAAMVDGMLAQEGVDKTAETGPKMPEPEFHEWESDKEAIFEEDEITMTCRKCCRTMRVSRHETPNEAMDRHQVSRDCAQQIVGEVMTQ